MIDIDQLDKRSRESQKDEIIKAITESSPHTEEQVAACWEAIQQGELMVWEISRDKDIIALMLVQLRSQRAGQSIRKGLLIYAFRATVVVKQEEWAEGMAKTKDLAKRAGCDEIIANTANPVIGQVLESDGWMAMKTYRIELDKKLIEEGPAITVPK